MNTPPDVRKIVDELKTLCEQSKGESEWAEMRCRTFHLGMCQHAELLLSLAERAEAAEKALEDIAELDCSYPDQPCLSVHPSQLGHGVCIGCKARDALAAIRRKA